MKVSYPEIDKKFEKMDRKTAERLDGTRRVAKKKATKKKSTKRK